MIDKNIKHSIKLISASALLFIALTSSIAFAVEPVQSQTTNETVVNNMTKADFIANVMDYQKNTNQWVYKGTKPCIIDFYADWCGPCRIASPILEELALEYKGKIDVYKVNVDNEKELSSVFGVKGIPAFLYCPMEGKPTMSSGIAKDKEQTKQMFRDNIDKILLKK